MTLGCNYTGSHFGAHYPDAICIDGYLWDLDSCDVPGGPLFHGGDTACPRCNTKEYVQGLVYDSAKYMSGNAHQRRVTRRKLQRIVTEWAGA